MKRSTPASLYTKNPKNSCCPQGSAHEIHRQASPPVLELRNISKCYTTANGTQITALKHLDITINQGEFVTIIGPSGCGKSTTLRIIAGFDHPDTGQVICNGTDITHLGPRERAIPIVFQNYALFPHMTVFENIAYGLKARNLPKDTITHEVAMICQTVNLVGTEDRYPSELSAGQQQRVALARALVLKPSLILFDEPLSNLDARLRLQTRSEIKRMQRMMGITVLYVTHDQAEALSLPDRVIVMQHGTVVQTGTPHTIHHRPNSLFVADFMTNANFIDGMLISHTPEATHILVEGQILMLPPGACQNLPQDQLMEERQLPVLAAIRPETCTMIPGHGDTPGEPAIIRFTGHLEMSLFNGATIEHTVSIGTSLVRILEMTQAEHENTIGRLKPGDPVTLRCDATAIRIFLPTHNSTKPTAKSPHQEAVG